MWKPGSGIAVHNVKCGVFHLFVCLFHSEGGRRKHERERVQLTIIRQDLGSIVRVICFSFSQTF